MKNTLYYFIGFVLGLAGLFVVRYMYVHNMIQCIESLILIIFILCAFQITYRRIDQMTKDSRF